jgi:hypothetical protein
MAFSRLYRYQSSTAFKNKKAPFKEPVSLGLTVEKNLSLTGSGEGLKENGFGLTGVIKKGFR